MRCGGSCSKSSVLVDMDRAACDFLLDRTDSRELLGQLDSRRLFVVTSGEDQPTYRFHNLFREFLLAQLQKRDSARHKTLLDKSAEWNLRIGMPEAAFSYFAQAGNLPRAARLAEEQVQRVYESGRAQTLQDWARRLYPVRFEVPRVYVCAAMTLGMGGNFPKAEEYLNIAEEGLERAQNLQARRNSLQVTRAWLAFRRGEYEKGWQLADNLLRERRRRRRGNRRPADGGRTCRALRRRFGKNPGGHPLPAGGAGKIPRR